MEQAKIKQQSRIQSVQRKRNESTHEYQYHEINGIL